MGTIRCYFITTFTIWQFKLNATLQHSITHYKSEAMALWQHILPAIGIFLRKMFIERILLTASFVIHACVHLTVHQVQAKKSSPESKDYKVKIFNKINQNTSFVAYVAINKCFMSFQFSISSDHLVCISQMYVKKYDFHIENYFS